MVVTSLFLVSGLQQPHLRAHDGPPFPLVTNVTSGPYLVSLWTDPDTTDDGTPGGQFWVVIHGAADGEAVPVSTRATVSIEPHGVDATGIRSGGTEPVNGDASRQFVALLMDREGRFDVHVNIEGPLGRGSVEAGVDATYDSRPPPGMLLLYMAPFLLVGALWLKVLLRRRRGN